VTPIPAVGLPAEKDQLPSFPGLPNLAGHSSGGGIQGLYRSHLRALVAGVAVTSAALLGALCTSPPNAPSNLTLRAATTSTLDIGWSDNSSNESGFELEWRASGGCETCFSRAYLPSNGTSHVVTGLPDGSSYDVRVRSWRCTAVQPPPCEGYASAPTPLVTYTTRLPVPTNVRAVDRLGAAGVTVAWNDIAVNESDYRIERRGSWEAAFRTVAYAPQGSSSFEDKPRWEGGLWEEGGLDWARYDYRVTAIRRSANGTVIIASDPVTTAVETAWGDTSFEWCSSFAVRPDQRMLVNNYPNECVPAWSVAALGDSNVRFALIGGEDVATPQFTPYPRACAGVAFPYDADGDGVPFGATFRDLGAYTSAVKARRTARGGPPIEFVHEHRFDLLGAPLLAQPEYARTFPLRTATPFADVLSFYADDTTLDCTGPYPPGECAFHPASRLYTESYPYYADKRIQDFVDARGPVNDHESVVYYMARSISSPKWHSPLAILANQTVPEYRAWRVAEAGKLRPIANVDFVELNQKFNQYLPSTPHWIGAPGSIFEDVHEVNVSGDSPWTAPPIGYGLAEYLQGWRALAADLRAAGVPFAVQSTPLSFLGNLYYDDPRTPGDDTELIREATRDADLVLLSRYPQNATDAVFRDIVGDLRAALAPHGGRVVVMEPQGNPNLACPYQGQ
jgi:Fibronectin type III domain